MKIELANITIKFEESLLGSCCGNPDVHREFIASKAPEPESIDEETAAVERALATAVDVEEEVKKTTTVFPRDEDDKLHIWDYHLKGFFKEGIACLIDLGETAMSKWQYKKIVDQYVFASPRKIYLTTSAGVPLLKPHGILQRPLRASTMQGERIALAASEFVVAGTTINFNVKVYGPDEKPGPKSKFIAPTMALLKQCLDFGAEKGFGQWRSGGYGRFTYTMKMIERAPLNPVL